MNPKLKHKKRSGKPRKSDLFRLANTRYLTRIIVYLSEVEEFAHKTKLTQVCKIPTTDKINDALNWLLSNGIIKKVIINSSQSSRYYKINRRFLKLREKVGGKYS